jgi:hypothetical protein
MAVWGSKQQRGQRHSRSPQERDNDEVEDNFSEVLQKKSGAKITLYLFLLHRHRVKNY